MQQAFNKLEDKKHCQTDMMKKIASNDKGRQTEGDRQR